MRGYMDTPHVILIMCDQLRADAVGFMGNPHVRTPHLDKLARSGVVCENMFVQAPVCMPSRACIATGRYPLANRMAGGSPLLDPRETTMYELMQRGGYTTSLFGKLHLTPQQYTLDTLKSDVPINDATPFLADADLSAIPDDPAKRNYGFQNDVGYEDALRGNYVDWLEQRDPSLAGGTTRSGSSSNSKLMVWPSEAAKKLSTGVLDVPADLHPSMFIAESAAEHFEKHHGDGAQFMQVSFVDPHHPWDPPREIAERYDPMAIDLPKYNDTGDIDWPPCMRERWPDFSFVTEEVARLTRAYYFAMMEMVDLAVGRLVETVKRAGEMENTLFVFVSDHGEFNGDYGLWRKGSMHYDCMLRVPCFFAWPGHIEAGRREAGLLQTIDLAPTILSLAGLPIGVGMQGNDLADGLTGNAPMGGDQTFTFMYRAWWGPFLDCWSLRTADAKLNYYPGDKVGHLFDLRNDPDERRDVYRDPAHRELRDAMTDRLLHTLQNNIDPLPTVLSQY